MRVFQVGNVVHHKSRYHPRWVVLEVLGDRLVCEQVVEGKVVRQSFLCTSVRLVFNA